jgi:hypothetical protein
MTVYHFTEQSFPSSDIDWRKQVWEMLRQLTSATEPAPTPSQSPDTEPRDWRGIRWIDTIHAADLAQEIAQHFGHDCEAKPCGEDEDEESCETAWVETKLTDFLYSTAARVPAEPAPLPTTSVAQHPGPYTTPEPYAKYFKNAVCFTCEGESGLPPTRTIDICEQCYGEDEAEPAPSENGVNLVHEIKHLRHEISKSPCGQWGHLMIHTHKSPEGDTVCDLCPARPIDAFLKRHDYLCPCCQNSKVVDSDKGKGVPCPYCVTGTALLSDVDIVEKLRENVYQYRSPFYTFTPPVNKDEREYRAKMLTDIADDLAAWLPAHDAKVRKAALEEAAQHLPVMLDRARIPNTTRKFYIKEAEIRAWQDEIRALADKPGPSGGGK